MQKEMRDVFSKLEKIVPLLRKEEEAEESIEHAVQVLEQSVKELKNPESGLITFFCILYHEKRDRLQQQHPLTEALNLINDMAKMLSTMDNNTNKHKIKLGKNVVDAIGFKKGDNLQSVASAFTEADGKPDQIKKLVQQVTTTEQQPVEIIPGAFQPEIIIEKTKKHYKKHKRVIKGHHIIDTNARRVEHHYHTRLTYERYITALGATKLQPEGTFYTMCKKSGLNKNAVHAHLNYGELNNDVENNQGKYSLTEKGVKTLKSLRVGFGKTKSIVEKQG